MTQRLNQIIATEKSVKSRVEKYITELYHLAQKPTLFNGFTRAYRPVKEDAERLPSEQQLVQQRAALIIQGVARQLSELLDATAAKDYANCEAVADVIVDGDLIVAGAPVTYLLFLEKQLEHVHTIVAKLPVLDLADSWAVDTVDALYKTAPLQTARTQKVVRPLVLYPATAEHPAQTDKVTEDVIVGHWDHVKMSGAIAPAEQQRLLERVEKLQKAVKYAREEANMSPAPAQTVGDSVFGWLLK